VHANFERVGLVGLVRSAGTRQKSREDRQRGAAVVKTRAQRTQERRAKRAARVAGTVRGLNFEALVEEEARKEREAEAARKRSERAKEDAERRERRLAQMRAYAAKRRASGDC
jgi:tRNA A37 methylthiotransferase MiaB